MALLLRFADSYSTCRAQQHIPACQRLRFYRLGLWNHQSVVFRQVKVFFNFAFGRDHEQRNLLNFGRRRALCNRNTNSCFCYWSRRGDF